MVGIFADFEIRIPCFHLILVSLDSLFHQLSVDGKFVKFHDHWPLNLTFDQIVFIFNPNLGIDLRDQLILKYNLKFDNFGLYRTL